MKGLMEFFLTLIFLFVMIVFSLFSFLGDKVKNGGTTTEKERIKASSVPKEDCKCWDYIQNICLPSSDCSKK